VLEKMKLNPILKKIVVFILIVNILCLFVAAEEESESEEPEYLEWAVGFIGFIAAIIASYTGIKAFGGMIGKSMKLYSVGILLIGIASVMCFLFYIIGMGGADELSVQIEDSLRTAALIVFAIAGILMYKNSRNIQKSFKGKKLRK